MQFSNIPEEVLHMELFTVDDDEIILKKLIEQTTNEDIVDAKFIVTNNQWGDQELESFIAWTENFVLVLQHTTIGSYLGKHERHPTHACED